MPAALIWLVAALVLTGAEALVGDLSLLMLGGGALAGAASSWLFDWPPWADGLVFLIVSVLLLVLVRPALRRRFGTSADPAIGIGALEGKKAVVLEQVAEHDGRVKVDGEVWSARAFNAGDSYPPGELVTVMRIDGATAVVWKNV